MDSSLAQKLGKLTGSLLRHPSHLPRYLAHLPVWGRSPIDLGLPWFSYGAIDRLEKSVRPEHTVFEFGSGGSSAFLARRARSVRCVENDASWHAVICAHAKSLGLTNLTCELHAFGEAEAGDYHDLTYFKALENHRYDIVIVDGFCGFTTGSYGALRPYCFTQALRSVTRPGGIIVVDDYWMYPKFSALAPEAQLTVYESTGPCRYGVTSTAVFQF